MKLTEANGCCWWSQQSPINRSTITELSGYLTWIRILSVCIWTCCHGNTSLTPAEGLTVCCSLSNLNDSLHEVHHVSADSNMQVIVKSPRSVMITLHFQNENWPELIISSNAQYWILFLPVSKYADILFCWRETPIYRYIHFYPSFFSLFSFSSWY